MTTQVDRPYLGGAETIGRLRRVTRGKVRDIYELDARHLVFVTTDRVSAFDVVMRQGVPHKGRVLTKIALHWFERTRDVVPNHLVDTSVDALPGLSAAEREALRGRVLIVERARVLPIEWVVRGYLAGSGWKDYQRAGAVCGIALPAGLQLCARLRAPILTPTTKSDVHDAPLTPDEARALVGTELYERVAALALALFERGTRELARLGILLADTKLEFGLRDGQVLLVDEVLTPDSSRFWPANAWSPGTSPPSYDKQILRDYLETLDWNKQPPPPELAEGVLSALAERYLELCRLVTGSVPEGAGGPGS